MPGYQPVRLFHPSEYYNRIEPIYGHVKSKKKSKGPHPLFDHLKSRDMRDRMDYERYLRTKDMVRTDPSGQRFDSLKLIGSCNDISYLDSFMSMPRQRNHVSHEENENRPRSRSVAKSASTVFGKGDKRNSIHSDSAAVTAAMLTSLRSSSSEDNLYESVEMIHYLKTIQSLNRQQKTRCVQKTGHPLFDHLRIEQAMKEPCRKIATTKKPFDDLRGHEYSVTSDGNSPSQSSSSSGDEYELYPRVVSKNAKSSRPKGMQHPPERKISDDKHHRSLEKSKGHPKKKQSENSAESDDEFKMIPRPRLVGRGLMMQPLQPKQRRRSDMSPPSDESDSSFNLAVLR